MRTKISLQIPLVALTLLGLLLCGSARSFADTTFPIIMDSTLPDPYTSANSQFYPSLKNAGIGTTNPNERLDVQGDLRVGGQSVFYTGDPNSQQAMISLYNYNYGIAKFTGLGTRVFTSNQSGEDLSLGRITTLVNWPYDGTTPAYLSVESGFTPDLTISSLTGYVGIKTTNPSMPLDVLGTLHLDSTASNQASLLINSGLTSSDPRPAISSLRIPGEISGYSGTGPTADDGFLRLSAGGGSNAAKKVFIDLSAYSSVTDMNGIIRFGRGSSEWMRLNSQGYLGIGTQTPLGQIDIQSGSNAAGSDGYPALALQSESGGFRHFIRSRHKNANNDSGNGSDFFLNSSATSGGSTTPGTGNTLGLSITAAGVGVQKKNPDAKLDVNGTAHFPALNTDAASENGGSQVLIGNSNDVPTGKVASLTLALPSGATIPPFLISKGSTQLFKITEAGWVSIGSDANPSFPLQIDAVDSLINYTSVNAQGKIKASSFNETSDRRLKTDIQPIDEQVALHFVEQVQPKRFKWKHSQETQYGLMAQDLLRLGFDTMVSKTPSPNHPDLVETQDEHGFISPAGVQFSVNYDQMSPLMLQALKSISRQMKQDHQDREKEIKHLQAELALKEKRLQKLQDRLCRYFPTDPFCVVSHLSHSESPNWPHRNRSENSEF
ncbi:MAG: tail fiber domain-containing protein [Bdellovibrionia bacterium]